MHDRLSSLKKLTHNLAIAQRQSDARKLPTDSCRRGSDSGTPHDT